MELALKFSVDYSNPIINKLVPWLINMCHRYLSLAQIYAEEFLHKYMVLEESKAKEIANNLVFAFPEHGFSIGRDRAKKMGLNIINSEQFKDWENMWNFYLKFLHKSKKKIIGFIKRDEFLNKLKEN